MCLEPVPLYSLPALLLAVDGLEAAPDGVVLDDGPGELLLAVAAGDEPLAAGVEHVVFHHDAGDLGPTGVQAGDRVFLTGVQVRLQLAQLTGPLAAVSLQKEKERKKDVRKCFAS